MTAPDWRRQGIEPDYRYTLANERTFLAWIRTSLALLAAGVLLVQFAPRLTPGWAVIGVAGTLAAGSALLGVVAYLRWRGNEVAMRQVRPLPRTTLLALTSGVMVVAAALLGALLLLR